MSLKALMSRITHRGSRPSSAADRALADARADAALQQRKQGDQRTQAGWGMQSGGGFDGGGF
jgi:hypothetical protein